MERKRQIGFLRPTARQSLAVEVASAISEELAYPRHVSTSQYLAVKKSYREKLGKRPYER
jgi:hypothetical protein